MTTVNIRKLPKSTVLPGNIQYKYMCIYKISTALQCTLKHSNKDIYLNILYCTATVNIRRLIKIYCII